MSAVLRVDLDALAANIAVVRARVAPAALMLVVKDDAYGHGLERVVPRAAASGIEWFGAFDVPTALRARAVAPDTARIFVWMLAGEQSIGQALEADIDLGIGDADLLEDVARVALLRGERARIHLKIDTGLHRNGIRPEAWSRAVARVAELHAAGVVELVGVWSHIAEASDAEDDAARALFEQAVAEVAAAGLPTPLRHLAASAASEARPEFRYDLVRVGAFCYGIRPAGGPSDAALGIEPIGTLEATVTAVAAESVTIDIGATDGLPSSLSGLVSVLTPGGRRLLEKVDDLTSSVAAWPSSTVGDVVRIYGADAAGPTDLGEAIDTIGEEIALRVSPLVERCYS